ncbi:hypothetical protein LEMLEM_LOCUS4721 [Lemmus lemmus]
MKVSRLHKDDCKLNTDDWKVAHAELSVRSSCICSTISAAM